MNYFVKRSTPAMLLLMMLAPAIAHSAPLVGEDLFKALGCRGCHLAGSSGGSRGPALDGLGKRFSPEQLRRTLILRREASVMPSYDHLTEPELAALLLYLQPL
jgi:mono/diheme cytochrome c family protein